MPALADRLLIWYFSKIRKKPEAPLQEMYDFLVSDTNCVLKISAINS